MKLDIGKAWDDAVGLLSQNRDLIVVVAGAFLFLPALVLGIFAPGAELEAAAGSASDPQQIQAAFAAYFFDNWPIILAYGLIGTIGTLALLALLGRTQRPTVGEAIKIGVTAMIPYIVATLLVGLVFGLFIGLVGGLSAVAGPAVAVILGIALFIAAVFVYFRLILIGPIMAIEGNLNPISAIKGSWNLVKGNTRWVALFLILLIIVLLVISTLVGGAFGLIAALIPSETVSLWTMSFFEALIGAITSTISIAIYAALYKQLSGPSAEDVTETFE